MKQQLLTDIELDVHELKYLMDSFLKEPTPALSGLLKRSILRMQERLTQLKDEVESAQVTQEVSEEVVATPFVLPIAQENADTGEPYLKVAEPKPLPEADKTASPPPTVETVLLPEATAPPASAAPSLLAAMGDLRHFISLNDTFRFSRELFGGDTALLQRVVEQLSAMTAYDTAVAFLRSKTDVADDNEALGDFLDLLSRYFTPST